MPPDSGAEQIGSARVARLLGRERDMRHRLLQRLLAAQFAQQNLAPGEIALGLGFGRNPRIFFLAGDDGAAEGERDGATEDERGGAAAAGGGAGGGFSAPDS